MTDLQHRIDPTIDPERANSAIASLLADDAPTAPTIAPQPDGFVRLAGGLVRGLDASEVSYEAEVRELTGIDEEYIDRVRAGRPDKFIEAIIERGTVSIGDHPSSKQLIGELLLGDAELLYMEIRRATYGDAIEYENIQCPHCGETMDLTIEIDDIPIARLEKSEDRFFDVPLRRGRVAHCRLPRFSDLISELANESLNDAERRTILLSRVVLSVTDASGNTAPIAGSVDGARVLPTADRTAIIEALGKRKVGPKYNEVKFTHETCGEEVPFPLAMGDLFPNL